MNINEKRLIKKQSINLLKNIKYQIQYKIEKRMIEHQEEQQMAYLQSQQNQQQHENDVFESVSGESAADDQDKQTQLLLQNNQHFTLTPLTFPSPEKHTMHLIELYQQNTNLIRQLRQQISRLSQIKKGNLFIKYDNVKTNFYQQQSQFFLSSQALYNERQQELQKIKREIREVDREQLTTLMSKNKHVFKLAEAYFEKFRTVVEGDIYGEELVVLTEEKRKVHMRGIKKHNNCQEKNTHSVGQQRIMRNESQRIDNDSTSNSKIKRPAHQKTKRLFNLRFLHLSHLFPTFLSQQTSIGTTFFTLGEKTQSVPRSFVMDSEKKFILVLYSTNVIIGYYFRQGSQEEIKDERLSSHRSNHQDHRIGDRLKEVHDFKIEIDLNCQVVFFSLRESQLYLLTSDSVLRVYQIVFNSMKKQLSYDITTVLCCLNSDQPLGQIQQVAFNKLNKDEILFTTSSNKLCKVSLQKYKTEIIRSYLQKVVCMNADYIELETEKGICVNYCEQSERKYILKEQLGKLFEKKGSKDLFKICTLMEGQQIHFVQINKHGLLTGCSKDLQQQSFH